MKPKLLSIVIPAYNEEKRIFLTLDKIRDYLEKNELRHEIIIVDDGSVQRLHIKNATVLRNEKNMGKGFSVRRGFLESRGDYVLFSDADLSTPIEELSYFLHYIPDYDLVISSRKMKRSRVIEAQPFWRVFAGNIFPFFVRFITSLKNEDTQCGFKLFRKDRCKKIFEMQRINGFCFDVEILFLAGRRKLKVKELPVRWLNNRDSKFSFFRHSSEMFFDLIRIRLNDMVGKYN